MFTDEFEASHPFSRGRSGFAPGGFRAGRGMIEPAILRALTNKPMHGYEIITTIEETSHGLWRPSAGSVYPTLQLLEEKDFVRAKEIGGKKVYELTEEGKAAANQTQDQQDAWAKHMNPMNHGYQRQFHREVGEVFKLMRQIFRKGTPEQRQAMGQATLDFKKRIEQIMNGETA